MSTTMDKELLRTSAGAACRLMKVLSNPDRMLILCEISQGEKCVGELEAILDIHQPTLSQQLTVLRNEELVQTRRAGKLIYYSLSSPIVVAVMATLYEHYCQK